MARINLLPWREERRAELKRQFYIVLSGCAVVGAATVYAYNTHIESNIRYQSQRNQFIEQEQKKLDEDIAEIKELEKQREQLIERMRVIQDLQGNRSIVVHHIDQLVKTVPDGVYYTRVEKKGNRFGIQGIAEANNRVSNLMRNLSSSDWFKDPVLAEVKATDRNVERSSSRFVLSVSGTSPKSYGDSDTEGDG